MPAAAAAWKPAKPDRMDEAQRSQSNLDRPPLRAEGPGLVGTALYGAVRRDAKQVAVPTPSAEPLRDPWLAGHPSVSHGDPIRLFLFSLRARNIVSVQIGTIPPAPIVTIACNMRNNQYSSVRNSLKTENTCCIWLWDFKRLHFLLI